MFDLEKSLFSFLKKNFQVIKQTSEDSINVANSVKVP